MTLSAALASQETPSLALGLHRGAIAARFDARVLARVTDHVYRSVAPMASEAQRE